MAGPPCSGASGTPAAYGIERPPLPAARWTQEEVERRPHHLAVSAPGTRHAVKRTLAPSCYRPSALDRKNFEQPRLIFVAPPSAVRLDRASRRLTEQKHRSTAGRTGADATSAARRHGPK